MNTKPVQSLLGVFEDWRIEDRDLAIYVSEVRDWMKEVEQFGIPRFGETATRLRPLRERLVLHFEHEDEMIAQLAASVSESSAEFDNLRTGAAHDHEMLLAQLDDLSARLRETDPQFESWQTAMNEVVAFVSRLEKHETTETNSIEEFLAKMNVKSLTDVS